MSWKGGLIGLAVVALVGAGFVLPDRFEKQRSPAASPAAPHGHDGTASGENDGLTVGSPVPAFTDSDVQTGRAIRSKAVAKKGTLLSFSEASCAKPASSRSRIWSRWAPSSTKRGIQLVSITPDSPADLKQAIAQFGSRRR